MSVKSDQLYKQLMEAQVKAHAETGPLPCENWPDLFFIEGKETHYGWMRVSAINLCNTCPLKDLCLDYALEAGEQHGIWGGQTASMRSQIRRASNRARTEFEQLLGRRAF